MQQAVILPRRRFREDEAHIYRRAPEVDYSAQIPFACAYSGATTWTPAHQCAILGESEQDCPSMLLVVLLSPYLTLCSLPCMTRCQLTSPAVTEITATGISIVAELGFLAEQRTKLWR